MVIYFYSFTNKTVAEKTNTKNYGGIMTGTAGNLTPFTEYEYRWFDPVSGRYTQEGKFRASLLGTWFAGSRPDDTDYVLLIKKVK